MSTEDSYINNSDSTISQWQKDLIDRRMIIIESNPDAVKDIQELFDELDKEVE